MNLNEQRFERAYGALCGLAIGDCMGMPTEFMQPEEIKKHYGYVTALTGPYDGHYHVDLKRGMVTDDTEVSIEIINEIVKRGRFDLDVAVCALKNWAIKKNVFHKTYLGPSTAKALKILLANEDPIMAGKDGTTDGAAMRVVPIGILCSGDVEAAVRNAEILSLPTHGTNTAIAGAAALAAAIAEAMKPDSSIDGVVEAAIFGANYGEDKGNIVKSPVLAEKIRYAIAKGENKVDIDSAASALYEDMGFSMETDAIVPVIIALFVKSGGNTMKTICAGVNMGGDTDTIGALAGALCGSFTGTEFIDLGILKEIEQINGLDFMQITSDFISVGGNINSHVSLKSI